MSYLSMGATSLKKIDVVAFWSVAKVELAKKFGIYEKDGQPIVQGGKTYPLLTPNQGIAIYKAWAAFGNALANEIGKTRTDISEQTRVDTAKYSVRYLDWYASLDRFQDANGNRSLYLGKYMYLAATIELLDVVVGRYVLDLSKNAWAADNIESPIDRLKQALNDAPGGAALTVLFGAAEVVADGGEFLVDATIKAAGAAGMAAKMTTSILGSLADIAKWGAIGGGLFMLYWYVLRPKS